MLVSSAILSTLAQPNRGIRPDFIFLNLYQASDIVFLFLTFCACAFLSRSFAGSLGKGETKMLLSYPLKRWQLFLSKFTAVFLAVFFTFGIAYSLHIYLDSLSLLEPMFYLTLFVFLLQLLIICAVTLAISMLVKNEIMSLLASILLLLGIDNIVAGQSYISTQERFRVLFGYFGELTHDIKPFGETFIVPADDAFFAILGPILIFVILIVFSFVYFVRFMEVD